MNLEENTVAPHETSPVVVRKKDNLILFKSLNIDLDKKVVNIVPDSTLPLDISSNGSDLNGVNNKHAKSFLDRFFDGELSSLNNSSKSADDTLTDCVANNNLAEETGLKDEYNQQHNHREK